METRRSKRELNRIIYNTGVLIDAYKFNLIDDEPNKSGMQKVSLVRKALNLLTMIIYKVLLTLVFANYLLILLLINLLKQPLNLISLLLLKMDDYIFNYSIHMQNQTDQN